MLRELNINFSDYCIVLGKNQFAEIVFNYIKFVKSRLKDFERLSEKYDLNIDILYDCKRQLEILEFKFGRSENSHIWVRKGGYHTGDELRYSAEVSFCCENLFVCISEFMDVFAKSNISSNDKTKLILSFNNLKLIIENIIMNSDYDTPITFSSVDGVYFGAEDFKLNTPYGSDNMSDDLLELVEFYLTVFAGVDDVEVVDGLTSETIFTVMDNDENSYKLYLFFKSVDNILFSFILSK